MAHPPVDMGGFGFVALVPLLVAARNGRRGALAGLATGLVFFGLLLRWVAPFAWFAWVALVLVLSLTYAAVGALAGVVLCRLGTGWWLVGVPSLLTVADWVRGHWPLGGFAWGELGATQHGIGFTRSAAAIGGVALLTWLVTAVNVGLAAIATAVITRARNRVAAIATLCAVAAVFGLGWVFRPEQPAIDTLAVGVVQANHFEDGNVWPQKMSDEHIAVTRTLPRGLDLVVWGESSIWDQPVTAKLVTDIMAASDGVPTLANAYVVGADDRTFKNTNIFIGSDVTVADTYVKRHVVPFGEYVPWRSGLGFIKALGQVPRDAVPGDEVGTFSVNGHEVGTVICFESTFPDPIRQTVREGAQAVFVLTNNASFGRSELSEQYLALTSLRAVETHRAQVVVAVSGRSGLIGPDGTILEQTGLFETSTLTWEMPLYTDKTLYVLMGDWIVVISAGVILAAGLPVVASRALRRQRGEHFVMKIRGKTEL